MNKTLFLMLLLTGLSGLSFAQSFAPVGAEWCYVETQGTSHDSPWNANYYYVEKDTLINDTISALVKWERWTHQGQLIASGNAYLYREPDKVYLRIGGEFMLLYDFNLLPGDSLVQEFDADKEYTIDFPVYWIGLGAKVDGFGYMMEQDSTVTGFNFEWGVYGKISNVFGSYQNLFGAGPTVILAEGYDMYVEGYKDSSYQYGSLQACDIRLSEGVSTGDDKQVIVSSQPGAKVHIAVPKNFGVYEATVLDMSGRVLKKAPSLSGSSTIALPGIAPGMYVVRVMSASGDSAGYMVWLE